MIPLAKFGESFSGELAKKWVERLLSPAFVYWILVGCVYLFAVGPSHRRRLGHALVNAIHHPDAAALTVGGIGVAVGGFLLVAGLSALLDGAQFLALRTLEGYWPSFLNPIARGLKERVGTNIGQKDKRWQELADRFDARTAQERVEYAHLDRIRGRYPEDRSAVMPTLLGNVLKEAETYSQRRYGLPSVLMWPRLWLVLPKDVRDELGRAQGNLNRGVQWVVLSALFAPWAVWAWWALPLSVLGCIVGYRLAIAHAGTFAALLKAAFDVHHRDLYARLGWALPQVNQGSDDKSTGEAIALFLRRGIRPSGSPGIPPIDAPVSTFIRRGHLFLTAAILGIAGVWLRYRRRAGLSSSTFTKRAGHRR